MRSWASSPSKPFRLVGEGLVVPGVHVLDHGPRRPARGKAALGRPRRDDLLRVVLHLLPGLGRLRRIEPGLLEGVLVVVEDRGGGVEGHGVEVAVLRVVAGHGRDEVLPVDGDLLLLHEHVHGVDRAGEQHGLGPHLEDLHDVRRLTLPVGGDGRGQGLRIGALAQRLHLVLRLALVELLHQLVGGVVELAGHGVPELDLRLGQGGGGGERDGDEKGAGPGGRSHHGRGAGHSNPPRRDGVHGYADAGDATGGELLSGCGLVTFAHRRAKRHGL